MWSHSAHFFSRIFLELILLEVQQLRTKFRELKFEIPLWYTVWNRSQKIPEIKILRNFVLNEHLQFDTGYFQLFLIGSFHFEDLTD